MKVIKILLMNKKNKNYNNHKKIQIKILSKKNQFKIKKILYKNKKIKRNNPKKISKKLKANNH